MNFEDSNEIVVDWNPGMMLEVELIDPDDFLKVKETLTRIGIPSIKKKELYQSCHILHKQGRYYITHFKELFGLDGKQINLSETDVARRNLIACLLEEWELIDIVNIEQITSKAAMRDVKVIPYKEKAEWTLIPKYNIGVKKNRFVNGNR